MEYKIGWRNQDGKYCYILVYSKEEMTDWVARLSDVTDRVVVNVKRKFTLEAE